MKYKKILATVGSVLMLGATMAGAFAASYPASMTASNTVVVKGTGAGASDTLALNLIDGAIPRIGGGVAISAPGNGLNFAQNLSNVKQRLTKSDLPSVLADGRIRDSSRSNDYVQRLWLGDHQVTFGSLTDSDDYVVNTALADDKLPVLHIGQSTGAAWRLEVDFDTDFNATTARTGETLVIAGKEYTVDPTLKAGDDLVLFASTQTVTVGVGESRDVTVDGNAYKIEVIGANTDRNGDATLAINGQLFQVQAGDTEWVGDQKFYVNRVFMQTVPTETASVEIFAGAEELKLEVTGGPHTVEINDEPVDGVTATVTGNIDAIDKIEFWFTPSALDEETNQANYLEIGEAIADPVFGTIAMVFESASMELKDSAKETIDFRRQGRDLEVTFTNRDGVTYALRPMRVNSTADLEWMNESNNKFRANPTVKLAQHDRVIVEEGSAGSEISRVIRMRTSSPDGKDEIEFRDITTGSTTKVKDGEQILTTGAIACKGSIAANVTGITWEFNASGTDGWFLVNSGKCATASNITTAELLYSIDTVYTENNAKIVFGATPEALIEVHENVKDVGSFTSKKFEVNVTAHGVTETNEFDIRLLTGNLSTGSDSDNDNLYGLSIFGTYVEADTDDRDGVTFYVPSGEVTYDVSIATEVSTTPGEAGNLIVTDSEAASMTDKNMVVVGGSAINSMAATLLGVSYPTAGEAFTAETGVGAGEYLVQSFARGSSNVAVLVAGYNAEDTIKGATYLVNQNPDVAVGMKYVGSTETAASAIVA